jgi:hypothetical protein
MHRIRLEGMAGTHPSFGSDRSSSSILPVFLLASPLGARAITLCLQPSAADVVRPLILGSGSGLWPRRMHVSTVNCRYEPIPLSGCRSHSVSLEGLRMESRLPVRGRDSRLPGWRFPVSFSFAQYPIGSFGQVSSYRDGCFLVVLASPNAPVQP